MGKVNLKPLPKKYKKDGECWSVTALDSECIGRPPSRLLEREDERQGRYNNRDLDQIEQVLGIVGTQKPTSLEFCKWVPVSLSVTYFSLLFQTIYNISTT